MHIFQSIFLRDSFFCFHRIYCSMTEAPTKLLLRSVTTAPQVITPSFEEHFKPLKNRTPQQRLVQTLKKLLQIKEIDALVVATKHRHLSLVPIAVLKNNFETCEYYNIALHTVLKYPGVLSDFILKQKLTELQRLPYDVNVTVSLSTMPYRKLRLFVKNEVDLGHRRIDNFSKILSVNVQTVCELLCKKAFLRSFSVERLAEATRILTMYGFTTQDICRDLWVVRSSFEKMNLTLSKLKELDNNDSIKTWMVRAQPHITENYFRRRSDNKLILGDNSLAEYLSERLECNVETVNFLIAKHPALKNKSLKKIKEVIDFLYSKGFSSQQICRVPKILLHGVETTQKRLHQLDEKGLKIDSLYMLTKSQKQYNQYYRALLMKSEKNIDEETPLF